MKREVTQVKSIAFTIGNLSGGGAERVVSILANTFVQRGIHVHVFCIGRKQAPVHYAIDPRVSIVHIPVEHKNQWIGKIQQLQKVRRRLASA